MSQLPAKVILHTPREQLATRAGKASRQSRLALTTTTGLAITGALVVAVGIAGSVLGSQRTATPAANAPQMMRTGTSSASHSASWSAGVPEWAAAEGGSFGAGYRPGAFAGFASPEVWAQLEGGALGGVTQLSAAVNPSSEWVHTKEGFYPEDPNYGGPFPQRVTAASATADRDFAPAIGVGTGDDGLGGYPVDGFNSR